uniref:Transmembrane protein n=1 Tax=Macrostomum lignano TaxID=282301 RepID=A0A1I8FKG1_9PLAT
MVQDHSQGQDHTATGSGHSRVQDHSQVQDTARLQDHSQASGPQPGSGPQSGFSIRFASVEAMNFDAIPAMAAEQPEHSTDSELTAYARLVPSWVLRGHSASTNTFSGFWSAFFFIPAGATGLAGGRGRANTLCCIVSCLVLSILAACVGFLAILANALMASGSAYRCDRNIYWCVRFMPSDILWVPVVFLLSWWWPSSMPPSPAAPPAAASTKNRQDPPAMSQSSDFTSSVRQLPHRLLRAHVIMGAIQITVGCLVLYSNIYSLLAGDFTASSWRTFSGFWTFPVFIAAGATGLAGGRGRSTRAAVSLAAWCSAAWPPSYADILWLLAYLLETVVAIVQVVFASRTVCCRFPPADSSDGRRGPWRVQLGDSGDGAAYATKTGNSYIPRMKAAAAGSDVILSGEEPPVSRAPGAGHVIAGVSQISLGCQVAFVTAVCLLAGIPGLRNLDRPALHHCWGGGAAGGGRCAARFACAALSAGALCASACAIAASSAATAAGCGRQPADVLLLLLHLAELPAAGLQAASALSSSEQRAELRLGLP